jgi:choline dehydrogenase-like flavoprotein
MPRMHIDYELTERERSELEEARVEISRAADALGTFVPGGEPRVLPAGTSLHYSGTIRMGAADDAASVCDRDCRVWGFHNLFVGGNGVIPTATACNPTLTSVALATRSARRIVADLA